MVTDILATDIKILSSVYNKYKFTFDVTYEVSNGISKMPITKTLNVYNFPDLKKFTIAGEQVAIGEEVYFCLKNKEELKLDGWKVDGKYLTNPKSPFKIGPNKSKYLSEFIAGTIGITENFKPIIWFWSGLEDAKYKVTENEIKFLVKQISLPKLKLPNNSIVDIDNNYWEIGGIRGNINQLRELVKALK